MYLRPDEKAALSEIEREQSHEKNIKRGVNFAKNVGMTALGAGVVSKIMPFLSEFITPELAMKGISKVSPDLGKFLQKGQGMGLDLKEGLNFIKEKLVSNNEEKEKEDKRNIIQKYSPELFQFLEGKISEGLSPLQAAGFASVDDKYKSVIEKIKKDTKSDFSSIIETVFGSEQKPTVRQPQKESMQPQQQGGTNWQQLQSTIEKFLAS